MKIKTKILTLIAVFLCIMACGFFDVQRVGAASNPQYVIDYALPVEINISEYIGSKRPVSGEGTYGKITVSGKSIVYSPIRILEGIDTLKIKLNDGSTFKLDIVPASAVHYEEAFGFYPNGEFSTISDLINHYIDTWNSGASLSPLDYEPSVNIVGTTSINDYSLKRQTVSKLGKKDIYGYDKKYDAEESGGWSNGTKATLCGKTSDEENGALLAIPFTGTGIEVRTGITPESGYSIFRLMKINDDDTYEMVSGALISLRAGNGTTWYTSLQADGGRGLPFIERDLPYGKYVMIVGAMGVEMDTCKWAPHIDGFRIFGVLGDAGDAIYAKDNQANPHYYSVRQNILRTAINNYDSIEEAIENGLENTARYISDSYETGIILFSLKNSVTNEEMEDIAKNGPKGEFALMPGQSVMFKVEDFAAIGMNALNKPVTYELNDDGEKTMISNLNMYYALKPGVNTITNTSKDAVLELTDIRITQGIGGQGSGIDDMDESDIEKGLKQMLSTDVEGTVTWRAPNELLAKRPEHVSVVLNSSKEENIDSVSLIEGEYAFRDLPKYDEDMNRLEYSITAEDINGFKLVVNNKFDILYTGEVKNPQTSDNFVIVAAVGGMGLLSGWFIVNRLFKRR